MTISPCIVLIILLIVLISLMSAYIRHCLCHIFILITSSSVPPENTTTAAILPIFTSSADYCSICLSSFVTNNELRQLPLCCLTFHAHCIDQWLESRSNPSCPLCRAPVFVSDDEILERSSGGGDSLNVDIVSIDEDEDSEIGRIEEESEMIRTIEEESEIVINVSDFEVVPARPPSPADHFPALEPSLVAELSWPGFFTWNCHRNLEAASSLVEEISHIFQ